jgi:ATP-dependent Clp protease protease subunit
MRKFWNFTSGGEASASDEGNVLRIDGYIAETSWFEDDVTPKQFAAELENIKGDLIVWINSGGGDCFAASQIYTMLKEHDGKVTVKIDGIAASAASVIAMSGDTVLISPTALLMIHNPASLIFGEVQDLEHGIEMLNEVKESIINAYALKTGLSRAKISHLMDSETWFSANKAVELGFADAMLYEEAAMSAEGDVAASFMWNGRSEVAAVVNAMRKKLPVKQAARQLEKPPDSKEAGKPAGTEVESLYKRLSLISH